MDKHLAFTPGCPWVPFPQLLSQPIQILSPERQCYVIRPFQGLMKCNEGVYFDLIGQGIGAGTANQNNGRGLMQCRSN
jgi:hypothetical protein